MSFIPKTAFVLAAGLGTRMQPLTEAVPKPLLRVNGRALIDHALDRISDAGIATAVVNVHYLADILEAHLAKRSRPRIEISDERHVLLDTGGGVARALPSLGPDPFVIYNSDSLWIDGARSNLQRLLDAWDGEQMDSLMLLAPARASLGYDGRGDFAMTGDGRLSRRAQDGEAPYVFAGVSIAHPRMFEGAPQGAFSLNRLWDRAIDLGRLYGTRLDGTWMHVGTPTALAEAERRIQRETTG
jgi:Nucleoside-diphosphate-sugar pyrophosphorylase involved in lipopolysaccharide biosynthesis/translation initiation factor 2B, gamma/epsilon subunits (eIF-2Bgamma/eIF-2Bepsilon)